MKTVLKTPGLDQSNTIENLVDALADTLYQAGMKSGERLWRLPIWKEYGEMMESSIADIKNLSDKPVDGAITAGKFLEFFTDNHPNWAHLDIAGMAFGSTPISSTYNATGFGIHLLVQWLLDIIQKTSNEQQNYEKKQI